jgi:hypothetical protein
MKIYIYLSLLVLTKIIILESFSLSLHERINNFFSTHKKHILLGKYSSVPEVFSLAAAYLTLWRSCSLSQPTPFLNQEIRFITKTYFQDTKKTNLSSSYNKSCSNKFIYKKRRAKHPTSRLGSLSRQTL